VAYITITDLEARLGANAVRAFLDDDNDSAADTAAINQIIADAESKVNGYARGIYTIPFTAPIPVEVKRLALDVAHAYMAMRHPEYVHGNWKELMDHADAQLRDLRNGKTRLDVMTTPEPAANQGGTVETPELDGDEETTRYFDDTGDF